MEVSAQVKVREKKNLLFSSGFATGFKNDFYRLCQLSYLYADSLKTGWSLQIKLEVTVNPEHGEKHARSNDAKKCWKLFLLIFI